MGKRLGSGASGGGVDWGERKLGIMKSRSETEEIKEGVGVLHHQALLDDVESHSFVSRRVICIIHNFPSLHLYTSIGV